ncbi:peptidoglycan meso-diaminopimelic acid protein amidase [Franconibacter pulveris 1160]|jgi:murein L,D-transpeptidase YafK|uniref:Transpeptidase n=2 Tax=Franconibacter TaxID=1649295 RepID=A0A0J8VVB9_9ENTR|nr:MULTISPECIES: peptidoglycan meso-diaminopimelic acid protein amidase [Franconibacter]KMV36440.1 transpeptidase [Franconibacter pulveris]MCK1966801.1 peptidoglycan meso-diaminopimelic acid protein amidase [Franconibacter sp. IITDAS19]GGD06572.1 transpeptidase [Franconibacter daqui]HBI11652.1 transpeptidase [Franconibacter pulveris]
MRKIALFIAMLLMPCMSFASLLSSDSNTPIKSELKQQLMGSPVYIQIFKEERTLDLYVKMGEQYQLLDSYKICNYSGGLGPKQRQGDFKSPEGFYTVERPQLKPDSRFYKAINIGFPNAYDRAHGYEGKYLMIHGACVSVGCYAMTDKNIDEIFQFVTGALVFGQPRVQISIYPFRMTDANMERHKYSYYINFWKQLKPGYDYFAMTRQPPVVSVSNGNYVVSKPISSQVVHPQLASNYTLPKAE